MTDAHRPSLSTHVLDTERGEPAVGMPIELARLEGAEWRSLATATTNDDGRITDLVEAPLAAGTYRLSFDVAAYLNARGAAVPFLRRATVEFEIHDTARHYHVPLLVSPYSCTSYRGS